MPQFRLELPDRRPPFSRTLRVIYTKNAYSEGVKMDDWQHKLFAKPIDFNPLCPGEVNQFRSHYNRFGLGTEINYATTTGDAFGPIVVKQQPIEARKFMENYYSFDDARLCLKRCKAVNCPDLHGNEYVTTMQYSYRVPHAYAMQRLAFPKIPFFQNRKFRNDDPRASPCKFYDESFPRGTQELQKHKGFRWKTSFTPDNQ